MERIMPDWIKGFLTTAVILLMIWSEVPFIVGLAAGIMWFLTIVTVLVVVGGTYVVATGTIGTIGDYDKANKSIAKLSKPWWKYAYGSAMGGLLSWSIYVHGYTITAYTYFFTIAALGFILLPVFKAILKDRVEDYIAHNPDV
jgi:hypothetical protein